MIKQLFLGILSACIGSGIGYWIYLVDKKNRDSWAKKPEEEQQ